MIFVVGLPHSGTTLLSTIVGANSKCLLIPMETAAYTKTHIKTLRGPFVKQIQNMDAEFVVEKTPSHVFAIDKILEDFPDAKFLVSVRNPIDVIVSTFKRDGLMNKVIYDCSNDLTGCINALSHDSAMLVQYENVVKDFEKTIADVCRFVGLDFEESMVNFHENAPTWFKNFIDGDPHHMKRAMQVKQPLFDATGSGEGFLSEDDLARVEFDCMWKYRGIVGGSNE
jgi:hypothetical protein